MSVKIMENTGVHTLMLKSFTDFFSTGFCGLVGDVVNFSRAST